MNGTTKSALRRLTWLVAAMATMIFAFAGTLSFWQAWLYLAVFSTASLAMTCHLAKHDPRLLERRARGGPLAENTTTQKVIMSLASLGFAALLIVPALDRRFGWSNMPAPISLLGDVLLALSFLAIMRVFNENSFAAATIVVEAGQKVISTGLYARVRHPMYAAGMLLLAALPLSLGSWRGFVVFIPLLPVLVWRLLDEERFLKDHLAGYREYCARVKTRLLPFIW